MSTIVTRASKGSTLSWTEADANFTNLNNDKVETSALGDSALLDVGTAAGTVAAGDHTHTGVYEPADATILKDADIGSTVLGYVAPSTSGKVLTSNGSAWTSAALPALATAAQTDQETATSTILAVTPGRQQYHPSSAKAWINWNGTGTPAVRASYNMDPTTPITDNGTGDYTLNIGTNMSSANYCTVLGHGSQNGSGSLYTMGVSDGDVATHVTAGSIRLRAYQAATLTDINWLNAAFFGDQA